MVNITGGCHCGAIRYQVEGELIVHALCHCADCRRHAGAPMVGWSMYAEDALKVTKGTAQDLPILRTWPAAVLCRLRHGSLLHQCECAARHRRHPERDLRRSRRRAGDGAYPDGGAAALDGARARTADLRALSAADIAALQFRRCGAAMRDQRSWTAGSSRSRSLRCKARIANSCVDLLICRRIFCSFADEDFPRGHAIGSSSTAFHIAVRAVTRLSAFAARYPIGWGDFINKRISPMTKSIPILATALF